MQAMIQTAMLNFPFNTTACTDDDIHVALAQARTRIKICGLKEPSDVAAAVDAGADAVGFVLYPPSSRFVTLKRAAQLAAELPAAVVPVLLFVNPSPQDVQAALDAVPRALPQFHGDETPAFCDAFRRPYLRAVAMDEGVDLLDWQRRFTLANALLLDAPVDGYGGGGKIFPWSLATSASQALAPRGPAGAAQAAAPQALAPSAAVRTRLVLSGGLRAANVIDGMRALRPCAVDVSSGVERAKGVKDATLIRQFCDAVRAADLALKAP
jgi:phosphoribosylanthranilate isomerase